MSFKNETSYLFYDVLSGEFKPKTDPVERTHTLGRLMLATLQKGERQPSPRETFRYTPSWAPGAHVTAEALRGGDLENIHIGQDIPAGGSNWLSISRWNSSVLSGPRLHIAGSHVDTVTRPLTLDTVDELREETAAVAQEFYDRLHDANERHAKVSAALAASPFFQRLSPPEQH